MTNVARSPSLADLGFGRLFWTVPEAVVVAAVATGQIVLWNPSAEQIFDYSTDEAVGMSVEALVPDRLKARFRASFARYRESGRGRLLASGRPLEVPAVRRDGTERTVELTLSPIEDVPVGGRYVLACARDVTDRTAEEEAARRAAAIVESSPDAIIGSTPAGVLTSWNPGAERLYGYTATEVVGQSVALLIPPERAEELPDLLGRLRRGERIEPFETQRLRKDGTRLDVSVSLAPIRDAAGRLVGAASVTRDISARKRAEAEQARLLSHAEEAEARFRSLLESAPDAVVISDRDGRILLVNRQTEELFGYGRDELIGQFIEQLVPERYRPGHVGHRARYHAEPQTRPMGAGLDLFGRRRDGSEFPAEISLSYLATGGELLVTAAVRDVTARKRVEDERARLHAVLAERERQLQELVGRLILAQEEERRRVAYELHDGLAQTAAGAHLHLRAFARRHRPPDPAEQAELDRALELAQRTVGEARTVVAELRPTTLDDLGLQEALRAEVDELRREGRRVELEAALGPERLAPNVETTLFRVAQEALRNVRKHAGTNQALVRLRRTRRAVRLEVRDWGRGFDPVAAARVVAGPGERVGLSGMRERVALLGGRCEVKSRPGAGTRVVAEVPLQPRLVDAVLADSQ